MIRSILRSILRTIGILILLELMYLSSFSSNLVRAAETVLERIAVLPYTPPLQTVIPGFDIYDGSWSVNDDGVLLSSRFSGSRLVPQIPDEVIKSCGEIEGEIYIPDNKNDGYSGICLKVSQCGSGADNFNGYEIGINPVQKIIMLGSHRYNFKRLQVIPFDIPIKQWFRIAVVFQETLFDVYINNKKIASCNDAEVNDPKDVLRRGSFCFRNWNYDIQYRNFRYRFRDKETIDVPWSDLNWKMSKKAQAYPENLSLTEVPPFLVLVRGMLNRPNSVGNDIWMATPREPGCEIRLVDPNRPKEPVRTIFSDSEGSIYDMNLSFDAKTIFFSYRKKGETWWSIWRIGVDGQGLQRLTSGAFHDISPCELPDGDIIFVSTRRFGHTVCQPGPSSNLFRMKSNGSQMQCISMNTLSDMSPQILPDGRVLFTRWEYVDRDLTYRQSLWTQNPDGTVYQLYFGNTVRDPGTFWEARPLPDSGTQRVVATFAPHHGFPHGAIGIIDRSLGVEGEKGKSYRWITKEFPIIADNNFEWSYRDPYPLADDLFLCSFGSIGPTVFATQTNNPHYRIWLLNDTGEKRLLYEDERLHCFYPIPLLARERPPLIADRRGDNTSNIVKLRPHLTSEQVANHSMNTANYGIPEQMELLKGDPVGKITLINVYNGLDPSIKRGTVKYLRIMEQVRKTEELVNRAYDQSPVMSYGTYYAKRNWGTVRVEEDGSANFYAPALREIYFQALDAEGRELHRMTSAVQFMPGESNSCLGCHEPRDTIPGTARVDARRPLAAQRKPDIPQLPVWMNKLPTERTNKTLDAGIVDYPSVVQPVLDKYCISCHEGENPDGGYDLSGDKTRFFSVSYDNILGKSRSYRQHNMATGEMLPVFKALEKPLVHFYWLLFTPTGVHQPNWSGTFASRLPLYFTKEHCGMEINKEDLQRIYLWIDADVPYYGTYAHSRPDSAGRRDCWFRCDGKQMASWMQEDVLPLYNAKCASCHKNLLGGNKDIAGVHDTTNIDWIGRFGWINLTRPENSAFLTAHLSQKAGGRALPTDKNRPDSILFQDKNNSDYRKFLSAFQKGKEELLKNPRADMNGFVNARPEP